MKLRSLTLLTTLLPIVALAEEALEPLDLSVLLNSRNSSRLMIL